MAVVHRRLDGSGDAVHRPHRLDRVGTDRGLRGHHHRRGAVEDRVRDVACLGPGRLGVLDHRLEHLGRGDHGLPGLEAARDDLLLQHRHHLGADLDAEIATGDHQPVGLGEDLVERLDRLRLLDLRDHAGDGAALLDDLLQLADVLGCPHERERDVVDSRPSANSRSSRSFSVSAGHGDHDAARQVHALVRVDLAADHDLAERAAVVDLLDGEPDQAVVDLDVVAGLEHLGDGRRGHDQVAGNAGTGSRDPHRRACREDPRPFELADPELRPLEVGDQRERAPELGLHHSRERRARGVLLVRAVREVQPDRVHPGLGEGPQHLVRARARPDRRHDLGPPERPLHATQVNRVAWKGSALPTWERCPAWIRCRSAELFLDPEQAVVLGNAIRARRSARLDLAGIGGDREIGDRRVLGLARSGARSRPCNRPPEPSGSPRASRSASRSGSP